MRFDARRRRVLEGLASGTVVGALGLLQSGRLFAGAHAPDAVPARPSVAGGVVRRGEPNYETWRQSLVWHKDKPNRFPDMIVQATSVDDIKAALRFADDNDMKVSLRSGGHNATGASVRDGGMTLDVSNLANLEIDTDSGIARVGTGVKSIALLSGAVAQGYAFPTPHCPTVGMGGFLTGGGIGWNFTHREGFAALSVEGADIVLASGEQVFASRDENPDLFWAVRGVGPGFFGVITRFHLKLYPLPKGVLSSSYILPLEEAELVATELERLDERRDSRLELLGAYMHNPTLPRDAEGAAAKMCFVTAWAFGDSLAEARDMLKPLERSKIAQKSTVKSEREASSFPELFRFFLPDSPAGAHARYACDSIITDNLTPAFVAQAEHFASTPSPINHVLAGYGMNLVPRDDACLSSFGKHYMGTFIIWEDEADDRRNEDWLDASLPLADPFGQGHYINEVEAERHPEHIVECFTPENWQRLGELRSKYDPNGVFHSYLGYS